MTDLELVLKKIDEWVPSKKDEESIQKCFDKAVKLESFHRQLQSFTWIELNTPYTI